MAIFSVTFKWLGVALSNLYILNEPSDIVNCELYIFSLELIYNFSQVEK